SIDNCTFTFTDKVSNTNPFRITKNTAIYNNCTFHLNNKKVFLVTEGSSSQTRQLHFNNCVVNDALYLFHSDNALTQYVDVKLANTTINNLGALTNHAENAQFVSVADNSVLKQNGEAVSISADMTGDFTMECNHSFVDATCLLPKHCEYCFKEEGVALEHNIVTETTPADCLYAGSVKTYCDKCSTVFSEKVLPVTEHNYRLVETFEPTCKVPGYHLWACENCGMQQQRSYNGDGAVIRLPHNPDTSRTVVKEPTCTMGGYTQNYCLDCGTAYKTNLKRSSDHDCTETVDYEAGVIIYDCKDCDYTNKVPLDTCLHTPVENSGVVFEPTCKEKGYTEYTCALCSKIFKADFTPATGNHIADESKDKVVAPTCIEKGYTEHTCSVCNQTYKDTYTEIDKDAHNVSVFAAVESSCSEVGYTEGSYCSVCGEVFVEPEEIPKKPHIEVVDRGYSATCSKTGLTEGSHCLVCGEVLIEQVESPKKPHVTVVDKGYEATCENTGLTNGKHCSVCGEVTLAQKEIPKLSHTVSPNWETVKEPTETDVGEKVKKCLVCGEVVETEVIEKLEPTVKPDKPTEPQVCLHNTVLKNLKKATYFAKGYTGDTVCVECGEVTLKGKATDKLTLKVPKFKLTKGKKLFKVTYKKVKNATGFQVRYRIKGKWKFKTFKAKKNATKLIKNLKKGTYKVQIRAMVTKGKQKAYSAWAKAKKVKIK
ncbi:MAG: hypothetical protein IJD90_05530, partial [Clostridia bacterium]|nr:hypothetical protein [Clostridia bacterium]